MLHVKGSSVSIFYDDGGREDIEDIAKTVWRQIIPKDPSPCPLFTVPDDIRKAHEQAMRKADENSKKDVIVVRGRRTVKSFDFVTLKNGAWLSDVILETFTKNLLAHGANKSGDRIFLISPLLIQALQTNSTESKDVFCRNVRGFELHSG